MPSTAENAISENRTHAGSIRAKDVCGVLQAALTVISGMEMTICSEKIPELLRRQG